MSDLTKWPRLLVRGERITETQANEVLIRTCQPAYLRVNDTTWNATVFEVMGFMDDNPAHELWHQDRYDERMTWLKERWAHNRKRSEELRVIPLSYLYTSRISSSWIGGSHGWCNWDGTIGCDNYNVGKWPTAEELYDDWGRIADAFPFLNLTAQVISDEGEGVPLIQWWVRDGLVAVDDAPEEMITFDKERVDQETLDTMASYLSLNSHWTDREHGVSVKRLEEAVRQVTGE